MSTRTLAGSSRKPTPANRRRRPQRNVENPYTSSFHVSGKMPGDVLAGTRMNLSTRLADNFTHVARRRGEDCHSRRCVRIELGSESEMLARVRSSGNYHVELAFGDGTLSVWCDCSEFVEDAVPCEHLWACILAADERRYLSAATSTADLVFDCDGLNLDGGLEGEDILEPFVSPAAAARTLPAPKQASWQHQVSEIFATGARAATLGTTWPAKREPLYIVDVSGSLQSTGLVLSLRSRERKANGDWARPKALAIKRSEIAQLPLAEDRDILSALSGGQEYGYVDRYGYFDPYSRVPESCVLSAAMAPMLMPMLARTGRCHLRLQNEADGFTPITWDDGGPWNFELVVHGGEAGDWTVTGVFRRGQEEMDLGLPVLIAQGLVFTMDRVAPLAKATPFEWVSVLRKKGAIRAPAKEKDALLSALLCSPNLPPLHVPEEMRYEEVALEPTPALKISKTRVYGAERLHAELSFAYEGRKFSAFDPKRGFFEITSRRFIARDYAAERAAAALLHQLGVKLRQPRDWEPTPDLELAPSKLPRVVRSLIAAGWLVEAEGKIFRRPGSFRFEVSSGVDWFELHGEVDYGNTTAQLPQLLEALRRGDNLVQLGDGTYGVLPEEWLRRMGPLAGIGTPEDNHIRFRQSQAGLLDALLSAQPEASCDQTFARIRDELRSFHGVEPAQQPAGFVGQLRNYQLEGLSWMHFLRRLSFGGCLADDMGVGKTAQVLALLETRRELRAAGEAIPPSLVVAPRSLIFNWKQEAVRFTPQLRVLDHTGLARNGSELAAYDMVLATYGTLRRDILRLRDTKFDYVVLDEAQAVKNADSESSKAVRLLQGRHRLALSGTPVQNHLGELWTLFEFLNPGMLGAASTFKLAGGAMRNADEQTRRLLAGALRPFILRRTKEQVARELPLKTEQTMYCEMEPAQCKLYNELRQHYRDSLLKRIESEGLAKSKIQVLEALLRLRQAACHPGLLDPKRSGDSSAKLEALLEQLSEVLEEGHKALVFSQFTSLLKIVRQRLDRLGISYEYLDGSTRDRQQRVESFQNKEDCRLFLVSLKAGGLGLNLTAAEYVYILDPWWNPAVEAQAVDRAHRIGQTRSVFAYRLITRDTVEEKVLELQKTKRDLAAAIISADNSMIRDLGPEDLALLLS
jgi:superfamily II DNA or RNA helicase